MASTHTPDGHAQSLSPATGPLRVVLYIEDSSANLLLVERLVARRHDLKLLSAVAGYPGIEMARTHLPAVILMDINLPDISGVEILKILRSDPSTARIPIIALSSDAFPGSIQKGLAAGFFRYITKPFVLDDFMVQLNETLEYSQAGRDNTALPSVPTVSRGAC
jgi:CheY-like chemotaxis protein